MLGLTPQRGLFARLQGRQSQLLWEVALVGGGLALVGWTFHMYPAFEAAANVRPHYSIAEADHQIESAKANLAVHPDDINTYVALTIAYYQKGPEHYIEAMNALEKARALGATQDSLFFYSGVMYESLGLPDYAINEFSKYLRHHPKDYEATLRLANIHFRQKRFDDAQMLYKEALHAFPKDATAWFNYAVVSKEKGNYPVALSALDQAARIAGQLPAGGFYEEGEIYRLKGDDPQAFQFYQQELARQADHLPSLIAAEKMTRARGDLKGAHLLQKRIAEAKKRPARAALAVPATAASPAAATPEKSVPIPAAATIITPKAPKPIRRRAPQITPAAASSAPVKVDVAPVVPAPEIEEAPEPLTPAAAPSVPVSTTSR